MPSCDLISMPAFNGWPFYSEAGWGGILADDMGLGKTVQALSYLQQYANEHPECTLPRSVPNDADV